MVGVVVNMDKLQDLDEAAKAAWDSAMQALKEQGIDPEEVVARVGEIASYFHDHPAAFNLTAEELAESEKLAKEQGF